MSQDWQAPPSGRRCHDGNVRTLWAHLMLCGHHSKLLAINACVYMLYEALCSSYS